jgi:serine/threonine protein kinase
MAPEVISKHYDSKCDVWSCGIIMFILFAGHPPFFGKNQAEIRLKILKGNIEFGNYSHSYDNLIFFDPVLIFRKRFMVQCGKRGKIPY